MVNPVSRSANYTAPPAPSSAVTVTIPLEMAGLRLDQALARLLPQESRTRLARLIEEGHVRVDGRAAAARLKVRSGEAVEVALAPRAVDAAFRPEAIALAVVHEDADLLVIDKPAGLVVHPGSGNWAGTMLNALLHHAPQASELPRAGIVHRLDKDTSGLLVVAKNEPAQAALVRQLQARTVKRTYLALARGLVKGPGRVDAPIGRHPVHRTRMAVVAGGKPAVTHYRVHERFAAHTLLECSLETGRTHQIRVHLASIGHPIEGDAVYAGRGPRAFGRQALHAWKLAFTHPRSGKAVAFESPLPRDFRELLEGLRP
jgi:23S rRNA pseudouridine1911/1915/1917 synthase